MPARKKQNSRKVSNASGKQVKTTQRRQQRNMAPSRRQRREMEYAEIAFTQLRSGDWAVRIGGNSVQQYDSGDTVEVQMKDGNVKEVTLGNFIWEGEDFNGNAVELFAVAPRRRNLHNRQRNTQQQNTRNTRNGNNYHEELEDEIPFWKQR